MSLDPRLLDALLMHPCFVQDLQLLCKLRQSSKVLAAAVTKCCSGQLSVQLTVADQQRVQRGHSFARWLEKHRHLLQTLHLGVDIDSEKEGHQLPAVLLATAIGLQRASTSLLLQHVSFEYPLKLDQLSNSQAVPATLALLAALPSSVTSLDIQFEVDERGSAGPLAEGALWQLRHLCQLRSLQLYSTYLYPSIHGTLQPLSSFRLLTQLSLSCALPCQLQYIPRDLDYLELSVELCAPKDEDDLAAWLTAGPQVHELRLLWLGQYAGAQQIVDTGPLASGLRIGHQSAASGLPLSQFRTTYPLTSNVYHELADIKQLTSLSCAVLGEPHHLGVVCSISSLCKLDLSLFRSKPFSGLRAELLLPLLSLTVLTCLCLPKTRPEQLLHLPGQLLQLEVELIDPVESNQPGAAALCLDLVHLTVLNRLVTMLDNRSSRGIGKHHLLQPVDILSSSLKYVDIGIVDIRPVLQLNQLESLIVRFSEALPIDGLRQLSGLSTLQHVELAYESPSLQVDVDVDVDALDAWTCLPLRKLHLCVPYVLEELFPNHFLWGRPITQPDQTCSDIASQVLQGFGALNSLTCLSLHSLSLESDVPHVVALLHNLTMLDTLVVEEVRCTLPADGDVLRSDAEMLKTVLLEHPALDCVSVGLWGNTTYTKINMERATRHHGLQGSIECGGAEECI